MVACLTLGYHGLCPNDGLGALLGVPTQISEISLSSTALRTALPANSVTITPYFPAAPDGLFNGGAIGPTGGSQPHENMQPYLCINFIISLFGVFPSQT